MSDVLSLLLLVWGASLVVLATALTLLIVAQGVSRRVRATVEQARSERRTAGKRRLTSRHTQPV